jgi:hypothetical protein
MGSAVVFRGQTPARYTRCVGRTPLRIVSALLMSVVLTVPVLGAVCGMLCEPSAGVRAPRAQATAAHHRVADGQAGAHHHAHSTSVGRTAAHQHHAVAPATVSDAPRSSAEWNGRCCQQPTLTLAAVPVVRHELQIDPAVVDTISLVLSGSEVRSGNPWRDTSRAPSAPRQSNPVLRI